MKVSLNLLFYPFSFILLVLLASCSNNPNIIKKSQEVQTGLVVASRQIFVKPEYKDPQGNIGVSVGSGGHAGIYGSVDIITLGKLMGIRRRTKVMQEIIIRRPNGTLVAVTQPLNRVFRRGEKVRIVRQGNEARVIN